MILGSSRFPSSRCWIQRVQEPGSGPIIPPGAAHVDGIYSAGLPRGEAALIPLVNAFLSSLLADFSVRAAPKSNIRANVAQRLPFAGDTAGRHALVLRSVRLHCVTDAFADLYSTVWQPSFAADSWTASNPLLNDTPLRAPDAIWSPHVPLRKAIARRQALLEMDALVALALGITANELCTIYRTQFPVLAGYDREQVAYDANGRIVPTPVLQEWRKAGRPAEGFERVDTHSGSGVTYVFQTPFMFQDREADMRAAYAEFAKRFENTP